MMNSCRRAISLLLIAISTLPQAKTTHTDSLQAYRQIDTINPPGDEGRGIRFLASSLEKAGVNFETAESTPDRGNI